MSYATIDEIAAGLKEGDLMEVKMCCLPRGKPYLYVAVIRSDESREDYLKRDGVWILAPKIAPNAGLDKLFELSEKP